MMATAPDESERCWTVPVAESTRPLWLHAADCTESPKDLQRMRDLIQEDPSLIYKVQPLKYIDYDPDQPQNCALDEFTMTWRGEEIAPLWHACQLKHPACVKLILQASGTNNSKLLESSYNPFREETIISFMIVQFVNEEEKMCEILKLLLQYGISPNVEITISKIRNPQILQILQQYQATKLIVTPRLHMVTRFYSKILEVLFEHGVSPYPMILTESGSVLPLYPTLGRHLNPIPAIQHPDVLQSLETQDFLASLPYRVYTRGVKTLELVEFMKTLLVHGASVPPYYRRGDSYTGPPQIITRYLLFPFKIMSSIWERERFRLDQTPEILDIWGEKSDGTMCQYYEIMLELLKLYHQFGGSLWWKIKSEDVPCEGGKGECVEWLRDPERVTPCKTIIDVLEEQIPDPEAQSMVVGEVERMMSTPPSLQHSARLAIRRSMGYGCVRNLEALPLPDRLKKYLKFETE